MTMERPYLGEIRMFAGNFPPVGWMFCDGALLPIADNTDLFNLIGTTYGGDGESTFGLPDLRGRIPIHQGNGFILAETGGTEEITLTVNQIPAHSHPLLATQSAAQESHPAGNVPGRTTESDGYVLGDPTGNLAPTSIGPTGGSQPHTNFQPYLCINFIIYLFGMTPPPT